MKIGFIGTGTIASALVDGLCLDKSGKEIYVSPRNAERAAALAEKYSCVTVCGSNQEVVDRSDIVFLTILPKLAEEILSPLHFRKEQKVVTVMSAASVEYVKSLVGDVAWVARILPLSFCAQGIGPLVVYPDNQEAVGLLSGLGDIITTDDEYTLVVLLAITGVMSAYYALVSDVVKWGEKAGITREQSLNYTTSFFEALSIKAKSAKNGDVDNLANEFTPGGLNEMGLKGIRETGALTPWTDTLDRILARLNRKS